ncbi:ribonuclease H-like YkuK family protein [Brevibacillus sp. SYSU BS000544]|uniref:ribonuclease H-like YkuK family protein n=1 Tax=Brevibacillus sp. SYSU BS000544 TaxID=3416443 RepID=UPI003CE574A1
MSEASVRKEGFDVFKSPSKGLMNKQQVFEELARAMTKAPGKYEIVVGADSQLRRKNTSFVIAICFIHTGNGGTFYYQQFQEPRISSLQQRIYTEATYAVSMASELREFFHECHITVPIRIHYDIGENGPTMKFVKRLIHLAQMNNFEAFVKPDSYGASVVADKFTK